MELSARLPFGRKHEHEGEGPPPVRPRPHPRHPPLHRLRRPGEIGYTPAYSTREGFDQIARNWDYEGKQAVDDLDHYLLLKPASRLTIWSIRP